MTTLAPIAETRRVPILLEVPYAEQVQVWDSVSTLKAGLEAEGYSMLNNGGEPFQRDRAHLEHGLSVTWHEPAEVRFWLACYEEDELGPVIRRALQDVPFRPTRYLIGAEVSEHDRQRRLAEERGADDGG